MPDRPQRFPAAELVGATEAARRLGLSSERIRQLARAGELPPVAGRLGRQEIWRWPDLEMWATSTGRLAPSPTGKRQSVRAFGPQPGGYRLVVNEVLQWGRSASSVVHARIWEAASSAAEPAVVLLGNLEDNEGRSVTNSIEDVAMYIGARFLGRRTRDAQFYEYWADGPGESGPSFDHVTFAIDKPMRRKASAEEHATGVRFSEPQWRQTDRSEIEKLVGELVAVYTPGTYTTELVIAAKEAEGQVVEAVWDPGQAQLAAAAYFSLGEESSTRDGFDERFQHLSLVRACLASIAVTERERAAKEITWQDPDAPVWLKVPQFDGSAELRNVRAEADRQKLFEDHDLLWRALSEVRSTLADVDSSQRLQIVEAIGGGLSRLAWWEAGIEEPSPMNTAIARLPQESGPWAGAEPLEYWLAAEDALVSVLSERCSEFESWECPAFRPWGPLVAHGPTAKRYLQESVDWCGVDDADSIRLERLVRAWGRAEVAIGPRPRCGYDLDDRLVIVSGAQDKEFFVEWPMAGGGALPTLDMVVRADQYRPAHRGLPPVFLESANGSLHLLPSSTMVRQPGYTWGYSGTGPWQLTHAIVEAVELAAGEFRDADRRAALVKAVAERVRSGRTPRWSLQELYDAANSLVGGEP